MEGGWNAPWERFLERSHQYFDYRSAKKQRRYPDFVHQKDRRVSPPQTPHGVPPAQTRLSAAACFTPRRLLWFPLRPCLSIPLPPRLPPLPLRVYPVIFNPHEGHFLVKRPQAGL